MTRRCDKIASTSFVRRCRWVHRHFSFFFAGIVVIYALSGILMNHSKDINPHYSAKRMILQNAVKDTPKTKTAVGEQEIVELLKRIGEEDNYTKHYYPDDHTVRVFLKGGSSLEVDLNTGTAIYDQLRKRPLLSDFVRLHYNPNKWWTYFSDAFAIALIVITITGLCISKGKKGLWGIGGIELLAGILVPILFLLL